MRREAIREEIIRTTQAMIVRHGIRAVRVDEIARILGISKRTLYETFPDKKALVVSCLDDMHLTARHRVENCLARSQNPLEQVSWLIQEYVEGLRKIDCCFLSEVEVQVDYADCFDGYLQFWERSFCGRLSAGVGEGYILPDVECEKVAHIVCRTLFRLRLSEATRLEQRMFARTILRGIATRSGIEWIDARS